MGIPFTVAEHDAQAAFRVFAREKVAPLAEAHDREQTFSPDLVQSMGRSGYLGALVPRSFGGAALEAVTFGLLNEELGWACSSARSLVTVHSMVCQAILRWGNPAQQQAWLPRLASGERLGAFALTEPGAGSETQAISATARRDGTGYLLEAEKRWITFGQVAGLYLLFAKLDGNPCAFLVPRESEGLVVRPVRDLLGTRGSQVADLQLSGCRVEAEALVGAVGFGLAGVANSALDWGRYSVAWGCVGIAQASLEGSRAYSASRVQGGKPIREHQLIQGLLTELIVGTKAARLLCWTAGRLKDQQDPDSIRETFVAKYFASLHAVKAASQAVQIHGAVGCHHHPAERMFRDAKVMEIIEGSTQIQQVAIASAF